MRKTLYLALALGLLFTLLTACGPKPTENENTEPVNSNQTTEQKSTLKVALDTSYKPMEYVNNGEITGFGADLIKSIAKEMNREVELASVDWDEIFPKLYSGQYDLVMSSVTINDKRKETMLFSDPYFTSYPLILTRNDQNIKSAHDLTGKKVAVQDETTAFETLSTNVPGITFKKFTNASDALEAFANKQVDAAVIDSPVVLDFKKQKGDSSYVVVEDKKLFPEEQFGIAVNKTNQPLVDELNSALKKVKANGEYNKVYEKYFKSN